MSNTKTVMGQAANTQGLPLDIPGVFSTYLYEGNGSTQTVTNGIDLAGEGGLVWIKSRSDSRNNLLFDTERGANYYLRSNTTDGTLENADTLSSFNSDGFNIESSSDVNRSTATLASWSFLKARKFFDIQTWTGNGVAGREIAHNLGTTVGAIFIKRTDASSGWRVFHRSEGGTKYAMLQATNAFASASTVWNNTDPTSTVFTVGTDTDTNANGGTFVAYIFAHNDGDGEFGPDADQDIIKCGSYTGNGSTSNGPHIDLGFEPQWILIKRATGSGAVNWSITDNMRGFHHGNQINLLYPNSSNAESVINTTPSQAVPTPTGFQIQSTGTNMGTNGETFIYIAIRRGPLNPPEAATEVFAVDAYSGNSTANRLISTGFPIDLAIVANRSSDGLRSSVWDRLRGYKNYMTSSSTLAEQTASTEEVYFDQNDGYRLSASTYQGLVNFSGYGAYIGWSFRRAPNFFDCVAYFGSGVAGRTVSHNLGVVPEMIWVKKRNSATNSSWIVYHSGNTAPNTTNAASNFLVLDRTQASLASSAHFNQTMPSSTEFTLGTSTITNYSGDTFIAYLFATLAGVSKVGSVTHSGTTNVDCGFSAGSRFVMLKRTDATGDWYIWDSARGIIAGNDPYLLLNSTAAEVTNTDYIDPLSSGFTISDAFTDGDYIFYAIA